MKRALKIAVLALFVGFQAAQSLHSHGGASQDQCQTCHVVRQTPGMSAESANHLVTCLVFQRLVVSRNETFVPADVLSLASIRAPPAL